MSKKLTDAQIGAQAQAQALGVEAAALKVVHEVECRGSGFNPDSTPVILFERLIAGKLFGIAEKMEIEQPNLCSKTSGGYDLYSVQHRRWSLRAGALGR